MYIIFINNKNLENEIEKINLKDNFFIGKKKETIISFLALKFYAKKFFNFDIEFDRIKFNHYGKPIYEGIYFSFSNSGDISLICISNKNVGCDIEKYRFININERMRKIILKSEYENYKNNNYKILEYWTKIETIVKYKGLAINETFIKNFKNNYQIITKELKIGENKYIYSIFSNDKKYNLIIIDASEIISFSNKFQK